MLCSSHLKIFLKNREGVENKILYINKNPCIHTILLFLEPEEMPKKGPNQDIWEQVGFTTSSSAA